MCLYKRLLLLQASLYVAVLYQFGTWHDILKYFTLNNLIVCISTTFTHRKKGVVRVNILKIIFDTSDFFAF